MPAADADQLLTWNYLELSLADVVLNLPQSIMKG